MSPIGLACALALGFVLLAAGLPRSLTAQAVQGRILLIDSVEPLAAATVQLLQGEHGDSVVATGRTDEQGRFLLRAPLPGTYRLRAVRIGSQPVVSAPFDLVRDEPPLEVELATATHAVPLAPLVILSERPARLNLGLYMRGYYEREEVWGREGLGLGHFLDREDIQRTNPFKVTDAVRLLRGVHVEGAGGRGQMITFRTVRRMSERACVPPVFIDGVRAATGADIDDLVAIADVVAIEVYPGLKVPAEFATGDGCGVVAVWTG